MDKLERVARDMFLHKLVCSGNFLPPDWHDLEPDVRQHWLLMAQAAIAALEPMDKPRVKPLVWQQIGPYLWSAEFLSAKWSVTKSQSDNPGQYFVSYCGIDIGLCDNLEAAKAAAQADYEARILAAIEPVTVQEAARVLLGEHERCARIPTQDRTPKEQRLATMGRNRLRALAERGE